MSHSSKSSWLLPTALLAGAAIVTFAATMGNACMKGDGGSGVGEEVVINNGAQQGRKGNNGNTGHRLGGSDESTASGERLTPKAAAAAAAEARAKAAQLNGPAAEKRRKDELVGRLTELYRRRNQDPPFGLGAFSIIKLEQLYAQMKSPV